MTPREIVLEQIHHRETPHIPYTLAFEQDVADTGAFPFTPRGPVKSPGGGLYGRG